jgi:hypothetical protein
MHQVDTQHVVGQPLVVDGVFRLEGVPTDPTVVSADVRTPTGRHLVLVYPSVNIARVELGRYEVLLTTDEPGTWSVRLSGAGVVDAVGETFVNVAASRVI